MRTLRAILAAAVVAYAAAASVDSVKRDFYLDRHNVEIASTISGTVAGPLTVYLADGEAEHTALVTAEAADGGEVEINAVPGASLPEGAGAAFVLPGGVSGAVTVKQVLTHALTPFPKAIRQHERQFVKFVGSATLQLDADVKEASANAHTGTDHVESFSRKNGQRDGQDVRYGPFTGAAANAPQAFMVHFANNKQFITFTRVEREIELSMWGNVWFEEHYDLSNTGAELDGGFARIDYQFHNQKGNSFRKLKAELPGGISDAYYRDIIGNISTSRLAVGLTSSKLEVEARFPIFGGWKTQWYQGYAVPLDGSGMLTQNAATGRYTLRVPMNVGYESFAMDKYDVNVVLPENAGDIEVDQPWGSANRTQDTRFTYLDTNAAGRPVVQLAFSNVVPEHSGDLQVSFTLPPMNLYREPMMLIGAFLAVFASVSLLSRVNLSLAKNKEA